MRRGGFADPEHLDPEAWSDQRERNSKEDAQLKTLQRNSYPIYVIILGIYSHKRYALEKAA